jgi:hypothetical protein
MGHEMSSDAGRGAKNEEQRRRLAASLRENLKRRKAQQRARAAAERPQGRENSPTSNGEGGE